MSRNKRENIWQISGESHHRDLRLQSASLIASKVVFACVHASIADEMDFYLQQIINSEINLTWKNGFIVPMVQKKSCTVGKGTLILPRRVVCTNSTVEGSKNYAML